MRWSAITCCVVLFSLAGVARATGQASRTPDQPQALSQENAEADTLRAPEIEALFSPDTDADAKAAARKRAVTLALAGDGPAAFDLGVLFRSGEVHPANATERNVETARHWLEKCVDSPRCPTLALASLAELELEAGNDKAAMQWAQAWTVIEREAKKVSTLRSSDPGSEAYGAFLLKRCFERLDRSTGEALAGAWFAELRASWGPQLARMLDERLKDSQDAKQNWAEFFVSKGSTRSTPRSRREPAIGLFLLRASPQGGRAERVTLIEGLPKPTRLDDFKSILGRLESKPYEPTVEDPRRYGFIPVQYSDPRFQMVPAGK